MTEDQKYQGALYREKPQKAGKRKSVSIIEPSESKALIPRPAYVEDVPDVEAPPHVPSPPPAVPVLPAEGVNVFDFLVTEDSPNASRTSLDRMEGQITKLIGCTRSEGKENERYNYRNSEEQLHSREYEEQGFSYGTEPVIPRPYRDSNNSLLSLEFMTPAAKATRAKLDRRDRPMSASHSRTNSGSEKKRKRGWTDDQVNGNGMTYYELEGDTLMPDAPYDKPRSEADTPALAHSGLTGSLTRLLSNPNDESPLPSPEYEKDCERDRDHRQSQKKDDPGSPLKRSRHSKGDANGLGISIKGRAGRVMSMMGGVSVGAALAALTNPAAAHNDGVNRESALVKTRRRGSSSEHGPSQTWEREVEKHDRKKHKVHRHNGTSSSNVRHERRGSRRRGSNESPDGNRRKMKAIEYKPYDSGSESEDGKNKGGNSQMVVFGAQEMMKVRCESFLSFVTKGPESQKGCSVNKALKRWHREGDTRSSTSKQEVEKELWKALRLRKNDQGEIVMFF
jgi:cell growth-regulating nucleolar protein